MSRVGLQKYVHGSSLACKVETNRISPYPISSKQPRTIWINKSITVIVITTTIQSKSLNVMHIVYFSDKVSVEKLSPFRLYFAVLVDINIATPPPSPASKVHGVIMGPIWCRQDPGGPPCWPHELAIWDLMFEKDISFWAPSQYKDRLIYVWWFPC